MKLREACPNCGSDTTSHCRMPGQPESEASKKCPWWRCTNCHTYGDERKHVIDDRRRGSIG